MKQVNDAIDVFLNITKWDQESLIREGLKLIITPDPKIVLSNFEKLIEEIEQENKIYIRAYGRGNTAGKREEYDRFLKYVLNNSSAKIVEDSTNNATPSKMFNDNSGFDRKNYKNYRLSHVWDGMSKNPYAFCALWNMSLTPYFIDPLTGHETKHKITESFSKAFRNRIFKMHEQAINMYNEKMIQLNPRIAAFMNNPNNFKQFSPKEKEKIKANFRAIQI